MRLSVCLIAKNEERNLPRALASVTGIADEFIVVDTGSTDATPQIASQFGADVHHFEWQDDFAAARNYSIDKAHGDWIFYLDADEELLPESRNELLSCLESEDVLMYLVIRQDLSNASDPSMFTRMLQPRLFRRDPDLRFRGRYLEAFHPRASEVARRKGKTVMTSTIALRHYGYIGNLMESKLRRGVRLLEIELNERPGQMDHLTEYGRTLLVLGDPRAHDIMLKAADAVMPCLSQADPPGAFAALSLEYLLQLSEDKLPAGITKEKLRDASRRWFPLAAPLIWISGKQDFENGFFEEAEKQMRTLLQMGINHSYDQTISFNPAIVNEDALFNLGCCLLRRGELDNAERCFQRLLSNPRRTCDARMNIKTIINLRRQFGLPGLRKKTKDRKSGPRKRTR